MKRKLVVFGQRSAIAIRTKSYLEDIFDLHFLSTSNLLDTEQCPNSNTIKKFIFDTLGRLVDDSLNEEVLFLLCYRLRNTDTVEDQVSRDFVLFRSILAAITENFTFSRTIILGSPTGGLVQKQSSEAYHYQKDLQKSVFRYFSSTCGNTQFINLIELWSSFIKYSPSEQDHNYRSFIRSLNSSTGRESCPSYSTLASTIEFLFDRRNSINGTIVKLDNGLSNVQFF